MSEKAPGDPRKHCDPYFNWEETTKDPHMVLGTIEKMFKMKGLLLSQSGKILEIGTGRGLLLKLLLQRGYDAVGVDARPRHSGTLPVAHARIERLPFGDETFQTVISTSVFDDSVYEQDWKQMFDEIYRVLKSGGLYISVGDAHEHSIPKEKFETTDTAGIIYIKK